MLHLESAGKEHGPCEFLRKGYLDFPGDAIRDTNLPANAENVGSIPGVSRFHMPPSTKPVPQLLKPECLEPVLCNKRIHRDGEPSYHKEERPPTTLTRESQHTARRPNATKNK